MPNFSGTWKMKHSENFEELLKVLGVNVMLRKIAVAAASKPAVEIKQEGESFYIKTSTTVRTTEINFKIGEEFEEQTVDGRPCKSLARWESENKMVCEQRLLKGEGPKTSWSREMTNDGELILMKAQGSDGGVLMNQKVYLAVQIDGQVGQTEKRFLTDSQGMVTFTLDTSDWTNSVNLQGKLVLKDPVYQEGKVTAYYQHAYYTVQPLYSSAKSFLHIQGP